MSQEEVKLLEERLEIAEHNLEKAAEIGKVLLEQNEALNDQLEELRKENDKKLEIIEQNKYELQVKLDQKISMEGWYNEEITHLRQQLAEGQDNLRTTLETEKNMEVSKLTRQIDTLRSDLDHYQSKDASLRQKCEELEELLQEKMNQTEVFTSKSFSNSEELALLQEEVNALQCENTSLKSQMIEMKSELQTLQTECEIARGKLISREEELDDIKCQFSSVNRALEEARMEKLDLNCQLDALRIETSDHKPKGNSMFSELDDRRVEAEKMLISNRVKYESLKEKFSVEKQQNLKYKSQIHQLLMELSAGKVDSEYVTDLQTKLSQTRRELKEKIEENKQQQEKLNRQYKDLLEFTNRNDAGDNDYVQYLRTVITMKENELEKVKEELKMKNIQLLDEQSRMTAEKSRVLQITAEKDKMRCQNVKLSMKLDELRMKYEPESARKSDALKVKRIEKIPVEEEQVKIKETRLIHDTKYSNQSQTTFHKTDKQDKQPSQPLVESQTDNIQSRPIIKKKGKTVSISDEVEEHEVECDSSKKEDDSLTENTGNRPKGRRVTTVKHISATKNHMKVDECKNQ